MACGALYLEFDSSSCPSGLSRFGFPWRSACGVATLLGMLANGATLSRADVVIVTAISLEYQAAKDVGTGAFAGSRWEEERGPNGLPVAFRTFRGKGGRPLRVAVAQAADMGAVAATNALLPLVEVYRPRCVAMCGVCAGRPGKMNLGDVIAADRLFFNDTGKRLPKGVLQDLQTYNLRDDWKLAIEHLDFAKRFQNEAWWKKRPVPFEWQENWVLAMLHQGVADPAALPESEFYCPQWERVIEALWMSGHVQDGTLVLTDKGRKRIGRILIRYRNRFPDLSPAGEMLPFAVHVAPMGTGNQVVEDVKAWGFISENMRNVLGLEMEAAALGMLAHAQRGRKLDLVIMKGVMDFANSARDDSFKEFAARASAECLITFLRDQLEVGPDINDLLVPVDEDRLPEDPPPSALLNARYEVVPFREQGRESILAELDRWCDEAPAVAVRLLHAEAGVGKTRLAIEWMRRRQALGWAAGFLAKEISKDWFERLWALGQPLLVVLDYAESRTDLRAALLRVLRYAQQEEAGSLRRVRLLLLARSNGDWWQGLRQSDPVLDEWLGATPPHELTPLATHLGEREKVFHEAAERFARMRGRRYERRASIPLTDRRFERVLYLHMAALVAVEGIGFEANTLMEVVLDHEERFWEARARLDEVTSSFLRALARQMIAAATLCGGFADLDIAVATTERILGHTLSDDEKELLWLLYRIYQRTGSGASKFLPALEPELLGEGMVLRVASPKLAEERAPPDWIARVFPPSEETDAVGTGFEVLGRASAVRPDVVRPWIERLLAGPLLHRGRLALEASKAIGLHTAFSVLGDALADQLEARGDVALARQLEAVGIPHSTVSLRRVGEWVSRTLVQGLGVSEEAGALAERARLQNNLGARLSDLGRHEEALKATEQAVRFYRALVQRHPDTFGSSLAASLGNLSSRLSEMGQREEALQAAQEAVELYRELTQRNPDTFQQGLAMSLGNLSTRLSNVGHREEALKAAEEAVELYLLLAQRNPYAFQPDLASSLDALGISLSELRRLEEALKATQEAVELYRVLAYRHPDAFQPDLARTLNNLGNRLGDVGHREEALKAAMEAAELYRMLAQRNPDAFQPGLAMSLNNLGLGLSDLGRLEEALKATAEAVELYRMLAHRNPGAFQVNVAKCLSNLGARLIQLGRYEEGLKSSEEAVEIYRMLAQQHPGVFQPDLSMSLSNLALALKALGRPEALKVGEEAVGLHRELARHNPKTFRPDLARSLSNLGTMLSDFGKRDEALKVTEEAVGLYREMAQSNPEAFQPDLASGLNNLGAMLSYLERRGEALKVTQEAVELYQGLAHRHPQVFQSDLAKSLSNLGRVLSAFGWQQQAAEATREAVTLFRKLAPTNPFRPGSPLAAEGDLVGRAPLVEEIIALVGNRSPTILIGPRRSGKTWLLRLLERRLGPERVVRYVTLEGRRLQSADDLALALDPSLLDEEVGAQHKGRKRRLLRLPSERFRERFPADPPPVFLIDEVAHLHQADLTLFPWLRALGQEFAGIVLAGSPLDWVHIVSRATEVAPGSSFGNDVTPVVLGPIPEGDAIRFLVETSRGEIPERTATWVVELCGPWPFYLQVLGHALVEAARAGLRAPFGQREALRSLYEQRLLVDRRPVFEGRWKELPREVRAVLLADPQKRPRLLAVSQPQRSMLVDSGLCTSAGTWLKDLPFFEWIQMNAAVLDEGKEGR